MGPNRLLHIQATSIPCARLGVAAEIATDKHAEPKTVVRETEIQIRDQGSEKLRA
jgi:hypothetical protein